MANADAVSALYSALAAVALPKPTEDVAAIEADRRFTSSVAADFALRVQLNGGWMS